MFGNSPRDDISGEGDSEHLRYISGVEAEAENTINNADDWGEE